MSLYVIHFVKVNKDGDTMTGPIDMSQQKISNVGAPTDAKDFKTQEYVDRLIQHEPEVILYAVGIKVHCLAE